MTRIEIILDGNNLNIDFSSNEKHVSASLTTLADRFLQWMVVEELNRAPKEYVADEQTNVEQVNVRAPIEQTSVEQVNVPAPIEQTSVERPGVAIEQTSSEGRAVIKTDGVLIFGQEKEEVDQQKLTVVNGFNMFS